jgi:3-mercaptopyruvate sulfurtransferase SseA
MLAMQKTINKISSKELLSLINEKNCHIIDTRSVDAYNGWKLKKEIRGGHISGARSVPAKWCNYIEWIEIVQSKGILPANKVVIYGDCDYETNTVANSFLRNGYEDVVIYDHFVYEWTVNPELPMDKLQRYDQLVPPIWLKSVIKGEIPEAFYGKKFVICHTHYRNNTDYNQGHIPGAISLDTLELESPNTWNRRSPKEIKSALEAKGITYDTTVLLYGRHSFPNNDDPFPGSNAGHIAAMRCAFIMMYAGVKDVKILNGGIQSWEDEGYSLSTEIELPKPVSEFGVTIPARPELAVDIDEAKSMLKSDDANLVCIRSWREFIGEVSGYNYIEKKGRIPGAVFGNCGSDAYHMENYRNLDYTMREFNEVKQNWESVGITEDKHNAFYCGTGWRGSEAFINAYLMGWRRVSVFDGGWFEWSNDPSNPYNVGEPE